MKQALALLLTLSLCFGLCACGGTEPKDFEKGNFSIRLTEAFAEAENENAFYTLTAAEMVIHVFREHVRDVGADSLGAEDYLTAFFASNGIEAEPKSVGAYVFPAEEVTVEGRTLTMFYKALKGDSYYYLCRLTVDRDNAAALAEDIGAYLNSAKLQ